MIKFLLESFNLLSEAMFIATQQTFHADLKQTLVSIFLLKLCSLQRCKEQSGNHCRLRSFNLLVEAMFIATITAHPDLQMQISQSFNLLVEAMFIATPKRPIFGKRRRSRVSIFLLKLCSLQQIVLLQFILLTS